jgi:hypothetical protein
MDDVRIAELEARIAQLERELGGRAGVTAPSSGEPQRRPRRDLLRLAAGGAIGMVAATAGAGRAAADLGVDTNFTPNELTEPLRMSYVGGDTDLAAFVFQSGNLYQSDDTAHPAVLNGWAGSTGAQRHGIYGYSERDNGVGVLGLTQGTSNASVMGIASNGDAVRGDSWFGTGVRAWSSTGRALTATADGSSAVVATGAHYGVDVARGGRASLRLATTEANAPKVAPPLRTDHHDVGELEFAGGDLWLCTVAGTPGTWTKIGGATTAGSFHPVRPFRVFDSRAATPAPGRLEAGSSRTVSVAHARDLTSGEVVTADAVPAGTRAISCNLTLVETDGAGFLTVNPGGETAIAAASANWSASGLVLNNGIIAAIDAATRTVTIVCGVGSTHAVVDVTGYWR